MIGLRCQRNDNPLPHCRIINIAYPVAVNPPRRQMEQGVLDTIDPQPSQALGQLRADAAPGGDFGKEWIENGGPHVYLPCTIESVSRWRQSIRRRMPFLPPAMPAQDKQ